MKQAITYKDIGISLGKIISIERLEIRQKPGYHGELHLSAVLDSEEDEMAFYDLPDTMTLTCEQEGKQKILFKGVIRDSQAKRLGRHMEVNLHAYDMTYNLEGKRRIRSFQNISRTSHSVIEEIMKDYSGCICIPNIPDKKIGQIWFQYEETDWEFLNRFVSHYGERLYADATHSHARFQAGLSAERIEVEWEDSPYWLRKDFKRYSLLSQNGFSQLEPNQFLTYVVESHELYTLGSQLLYKGGTWFIDDLTRELKEGLLVCTYTLMHKGAMLTPKAYNRRISGVSVDGKIVQINRDKVRVSLNVDTSKEQGTYWFPFSTMAATADGSGWYSMPEEGDSIRVYFPTKDEKEGYVITKHDSHMPVPKTQSPAISEGSSSMDLGSILAQDGSLGQAISAGGYRAIGRVLDEKPEFQRMERVSDTGRIEGQAIPVGGYRAIGRVSDEKPEFQRMERVSDTGRIEGQAIPVGGYRAIGRVSDEKPEFVRPSQDRDNDLLKLLEAAQLIGILSAVPVAGVSREGAASSGGYSGAGGSQASEGGYSGGGGLAGGGSSAAATGMTPLGTETGQEKENPMDDPEKRNIFTQDGNMVQLVPAGVLLTAGASKVSLYKNGKIVFKAPAGITINAGKQVYVSGRNITLEAKTMIRIDHEKDTEIKIMKAGISLKAEEIYEN